MGGIKEDLLKIQQDIYNKLIERLKEYEKIPPILKNYYKDYQEEIKDFQQVSTKEELIRRVIESDVVFLGDFHTHRQSQKIPVRVLTKVLNNDLYKQKKKGIILCMEPFLSEHQQFLDLYLQNKISDEKFLSYIQYEKTWGQNWQNYKSIIDFAKQNKIKVFGINTIDETVKNSPYLRDDFAVNKIIELLLDFPKHLIVVYYGDAHICYEHIPKKLITTLKEKFKKQINYLIVHQNSSQIYWKLAKLGIADTTDVVYIKPNIYCVMNTTPIAKLQSQINWYENVEELRYSGSSKWDEEYDVATLYDEVKEIVDKLSQFLNIKVKCEDLTVYSIHNIRELSEVLPSTLKKEEIKNIEEVILKNESYFIPKRNIIILTNYSINHVAEEAMHYIHSKLSGFKGFEKLSKKDKFYCAVLYEAIGFCGSKIINHKRKCYKIKDFYDYIIYLRNRKIEDNKTRILKKATRKVIRHYEMEQLILNRGRTKNLGSFYNMDNSLFITVSHAVGYMLGDRLFDGLMNGAVRKEDFVELLNEDLIGRNKAFEIWKKWIYKLKDVKESYITKEEIL